MEDEKVYLVCPPVRLEGAVYPGSVQSECSQCGERVWAAPSGQKLISEFSAVILCLDCYHGRVGKGAGISDIHITKEALGEIKSWMQRN